MTCPAPRNISWCGELIGPDLHLWVTTSTIIRAVERVNKQGKNELCNVCNYVPIHHGDAAREFAYDRSSAAGKLDRALTEAPERGWTVVSMRKDWKRVFKVEEN